VHGFGDRPITQDAHDDAAADIELGFRSLQSGLHASQHLGDVQTPVRVRLRVEEDLSMTNAGPLCALQVAPRHRLEVCAST
jgi:hypothetical protein